MANALTTQEREFAVHCGGDNALTVAIDWIHQKLNPEDVFEVEELERWALENDYEKLE